MVGNYSALKAKFFVILLILIKHTEIHEKKFDIDDEGE